MKIKKLLLAILLLSPSIIFAQASNNFWYPTSGNLTPVVSTFGLKVPGISGGAGCLQIGGTGIFSSTGSSCGGAGGSPGGTSGQLQYNASGSFGGVSTSTLSATSPLTGSFTQVGSGGALGIQQSSGSQAGYLSSTDWTTFNNKQNTLSNTLANGFTATTTFYNGGVVFSDGSKLTQSSAPANFYWDETNKLLGIGTSTPGAAVHILASSAGNSNIALRLDDNSASASARNWRAVVGYTGIGKLEFQNSTVQGGVPLTTRFILEPAGNVGVATTSAGTLFSIGGDAVGINLGLATSTWSTTGGINLASGCYAIGGTCLSTSGGSAFPFTTQTYFGQTVSATGTALRLTGSPYSLLASSTAIIDQVGVNVVPNFATLEVQGTTTTATGRAFAVWNSASSPIITAINSGNVGIASTTPWGLLSVNPNALGNKVPEFVIGSSTATHFLVDGAGNVGIGTTTPPSVLTVGATSAQLVSSNPVMLMGTSTLISASANGTYIGINAPTGFTGNFVDMQLAGAARFSVSATGVINGNNNLNLGPNAIIKSAAGGDILLQGNCAACGATDIITLGNAQTLSHTSGDVIQTKNLSTFAPSSGTGTYEGLAINDTLNQTVSASGISRSFLVSPSLTKAADYRAIETAAYTYNVAAGSLAGDKKYGSLFNAYTLATTSAGTLPNASLVNLSGAPKAAANMTLSTSTALMIEAGAVNNGGTVTRAYGLQVQAPTGATTNYSSTFTGGNMGIGTTSPYATVSIQTGASTGDAFAIATSSGNAVFGVDNDGHRFTSGWTPALSSCGTGSPTVTGDDQTGTITTGTAATACTLTFAKAFRNTPVCNFNDDSSTIPGDISAISTTAVTFALGAGLSGGHLYYSCAYHQ